MGKDQKPSDSEFKFKLFKNYDKNKKNNNAIIGLFKLTSNFQPHHGPGVYSASNRNEHQKMYLW
jgi:hypothetical protein